MTPKPDFQTPLADVAEAAKFLAISRGNMYKLVREGRIPHRKYGKTIRIPWSWLTENAQALTEPEESEDDRIEIKIDSGIPLPPPRFKYPFDSMEIGQSFLFPPGIIQRESARTAAYKASKELHRKFAVHKTAEGLRCWRTE